MNFSTFFLFSFLALIVPVYTVPTPVKSSGVYVPRILTPRGNEVWTASHDYSVTWDVTDQLAQMTNPRGSIRLRKGNHTFLNMTLAEDFDILAGSITITVPNVQPGADYRVVLFGDSGNWNDEPFEIISADPKLDAASDPNRGILVDQGVFLVPPPWFSMHHMHHGAALETN